MEDQPQGLWLPPRTATLVVAASNSSDRVRAQADYVCDGVGDDVEIQAAIDACSAGDKVVVVGATTNWTGFVDINKEIELEIQGKVNLSGVNSGIRVGNTIEVWRVKVTLNVVDGLDKTPTALFLRKCSYSIFEIRQIINCNRGVLLNPSVAAEFAVSNIFSIAQIYLCNVGVELNGSIAGATCEGNKFTIGFISTCITGDAKGFWVRARATHTILIAGLDFSTTDLRDDCGESIFLMDFCAVLAGAGLATSYISIGNYASYLPALKVDSLSKAAFGDYNFNNLLSNGDFEVGDPPTGWTTVWNAAVAREATIVKIGSYSAKGTATDADCWFKQLTIADFARYRGRKVTIGGWVRSPAANNTGGSIRPYDGVNEYGTTPVEKDNAWHWVTNTFTVDAAATQLSVACRLGNANGDISYFDGVIMVEGDVCPAFSPKPDDFLINHHTAAYTISPYETGLTLHTNLGAGGAIQIELPQTVSAGFTCRFAVMAAFELRIHPGAAGAIYINGAKQLDDRYITAADEAESVILTADGNGDWIASSVVGTWTVE